MFLETHEGGRAISAIIMDYNIFIAEVRISRQAYFCLSGCIDGP